MSGNIELVAKSTEDVPTLGALGDRLEEGGAGEIVGYMEQSYDRETFNLNREAGPMVHTAICWASKWELSGVYDIALALSIEHPNAEVCVTQEGDESEPWGTSLTFEAGTLTSKSKLDWHDPRAEDRLAALMGALPALIETLETDKSNDWAEEIEALKEAGK
jgi:hypothetical protein